MLGVLLCSSIIGIARPSATISDEQFFNALNYNIGGLEIVKKCVDLHDYQAAKKHYVDYLKHRKNVSWYFDWRNKDTESSQIWVKMDEADRYSKNELLSCGTWHQFGDTVNWLLNPTNNNYNEWTWQLNRHHVWVTLGKAYWKTGDEKYARSFVTQLNSWLKQCDRPHGSGNKPGSSWRTLDAGIRMEKCWPNAFFYFLSSPSFDDESVFKMVKSFYEHGLHLRSHHTSDNWLSKEMSGLYTIGVLFPEFRESSEWRTFAVDKLYKEETEQFYLDGAQHELATGYHGNSLSSIVSVYRVAQLNHYHLPKDYVSRLEKSYEFFLNLMMPDGKLPAINDSDWDDVAPHITTAANLFSARKDFAFFATKGERGKEPKYKSIWMPWAGWYIMRSGWDKDAFYALFEVGPYGTGHQHEDKLSFILSAYGSRLITECGKYAYDKSQWRKYAVSARGHNVARIDGMDQNRANCKDVSLTKAPLTNKWKTKRKYDIGEGYYTEGYGAELNQTVTHHRTLKFVKNRYWLVTDEFIPSDNDVHKYDIWFHFNTSKYRIDPSVNVIYSDDEKEANIAIIRLGDYFENEVIVGALTPEVQGWVADRMPDESFSCRPVATPIFHNKARGVLKEFFVFLPFRKGEKMNIKSVKRLSSKKYEINTMNEGKIIVDL